MAGKTALNRDSYSILEVLNHPWLCWLRSSLKNLELVGAGYFDKLQRLIYGFDLVVVDLVCSANYTIKSDCESSR